MLRTWRRKVYNINKGDFEAFLGKFLSFTGFLKK